MERNAIKDGTGEENYGKEIAVVYCPDSCENNIPRGWYWLREFTE